MPLPWPGGARKPGYGGAKKRGKIFGKRLGSIFVASAFWPVSFAAQTESSLEFQMNE